MASFATSSLDEVLKAIENADVFQDEIVEKLLDAGSNELSRLIREEAQKSPYDTKTIEKKVGRSGKVKQLKSGTKYVVVNVKGYNAEKTPLGRIAFVFNYGRKETYGKITGSYFWTRAVAKSEKIIPITYEEILVNEFIERGLM